MVNASLPGGTDGPLTTQGQLGAEILSVAVVVSPLGGAAELTESRAIVTDCTVLGTYCGLREVPTVTPADGGPPITKWVGIVVVPPPPGGAGGAGVLGGPMGFPPPPPLHAASAKTKRSDNVCRCRRNRRPSNQQSE